MLYAYLKYSISVCGSMENLVINFSGVRLVSFVVSGFALES